MAPPLGDLNLPSSRVLDWAPGVEGGIPDTSGWSQINVKDYGAVGDGQTDDSTAIQNAIDAATGIGNCIVYFPPGTYYYYDDRIYLKSNVVVRGAGTANTSMKCKMLTLYPMFMTLGSKDSPIAITAGSSKGSQSVTLASSPGWSAGDWVMIELADNPPYLDKQDPSGPDTYIIQIVKVTSNPGTTLNFDRPLYIDYPDAYSPQVSKCNMIVNAGVEDIRLEYTTDSDGDKWCAIFTFRYAANCWLYNVDLYHGARYAVEMKWVARSTVQNSVLRDSLLQFDSPRKNHYSIIMEVAATDNLFTNNIVHHWEKGIILADGACGNVVSYNYFRDIDGGASHRAIFFHGEYPHSNLIEGNDSNFAKNMELDCYWGQQGPLNTFFRNRVRGVGEDMDDGAWSLGTEQSGCQATPFVASDVNFIANSAWCMMQVPCSPDIYSCPDVDKYTTGMWIERNLIHKVLRLVTPEETTTTYDNEIANKAPSGWSSFNTPASFYLTANPDFWWWNKPWPGIGAPEDDCTDNWVNSTKLPAQERDEGNSEPPQPPAENVQPVPISSDHTVFLEF